MVRQPIRSICLSTLAVVAALILLAGCSSTPRAPDSRTGAPRLVEGAVLVLQRPLPVPGDVWSVYFQGGELLRYGSIDDSRVYCELYLTGAKGQEWQVLPQRFLIIGIDLSSDEGSFSSLPQDGSMRLARGSRQSVYKTVLSLASADQPEVRELRCQVEYDSGWNAYPGPEQILRALGDYFEVLDFAEAAPSTDELLQRPLK